MSERATFFYDLGSPYAYLAAERISPVFDEAGAEPPEWQPILLGGLFKRFDRGSWGMGPEREAGMREVERRAQAYGLPPIRWPDPWPGNSLTAMRAATFAKQIGRTVSFSLAAFRQAFAAGRDLTDPDNVLIAAASSELHPRSLRRRSPGTRSSSACGRRPTHAGDRGVSASRPWSWATRSSGATTGSRRRRRRLASRGSR